MREFVFPEGWKREKEEQKEKENEERIERSKTKGPSERKADEGLEENKAPEPDQEVLGPRALIVVSSSYQILPRG